LADSWLSSSEPAKFAFARSTNYRRKRPPASPAPALQAPPPRRGRGHIVVKAPIQTEICSRHCSPPPRPSSTVPPASQSPSARRITRSEKSSSPGPRGGRTGSPMPRKDELEELTDEEDSATDDIVPYQTTGLGDPSTATRNFLRRASENLLRPVEPIMSDSTHAHPSATSLSRAKSLGTHVTFQSGALKPRRPDRISGQALSADEKSRPIPCPNPAKQDEELGWTDEARLAIRRARGLDL
jgi:hypothetical protein